MLSKNKYIPFYVPYLYFKITHQLFDVHKSLPWILFLEQGNNIVIYDIYTDKPIHCFCLQKYFQETIQVKSLSFFYSDAISQISNIDTNDFIGCKGIALHLRPSLLIIIVDKYICFYSYILRTFIRVITQNDLENKSPMRFELYDHLTALILTEDGVLSLWNLKEWKVDAVISKSHFNGKQCVCFTVITNAKNEKFVVVANKSGNLFIFDLSKSTLNVSKLDKKAEHDTQVLRLEFNKETNVLLSFSKNVIYLVNIDNTSINKKIMNFQFEENNKIIDIMNYNWGLNNKDNYLIYGKKLGFVVLELNLERIVNEKIDANTYENFMSGKFFMELSDRMMGKKEGVSSKIMFLYNTNDCIVFSMKNIIIVLRIEPSFQKEIIPNELLINNNNNNNNNEEEHLYYFIFTQSHSLCESIYMKDNYSNNRYKRKVNVLKDSLLSNNSSNNKEIKIKGSLSYEIQFSYNKAYLSCLSKNELEYKIYKTHITDDNKCEYHLITSGSNSISFEWCPYDNIFAYVDSKSFTSTANPTTNQDHKPTNKHPYHKMQFTLHVCKLISSDNTNIIQLYEIENLPSHKLFKCHFLGCFELTTSQHSVPFEHSVLSSCTYKVSNEVEIVFYSWEEKRKVSFTLSEEPLHIYTSTDLHYMIICFNKKYLVYTFNISESKLTLMNINYHSVLDGVVYEDFIFVFLTVNGIYFHILNNVNAYPFKLFHLSDSRSCCYTKMQRKQHQSKSECGYEKQFQQMILGIYDNKLFTANCFKDVFIQEIEHVLFRIVAAIKTNPNDYVKVRELIAIVEKKYINDVLNVLEFYYENDERVFREIFTKEMIMWFKLYEKVKFFEKDFMEMKGVLVNKKGELETIMKRNIINAVQLRNENEIQALDKELQFYKLGLEVICARSMDRNTFFNSLLSKHKYFEAYAFNANHNIKDMNSKILSKAVDNLNMLQKK